MRIEQSKHVWRLHVESFRRDTRLRIALYLSGLLVSALILSGLALNAATGRSVAPWQWLGGVALGPLCVAMGVAAFWADVRVNRFAEIRGDRIRLGPYGRTIQPAHLIYCQLKPDTDFPGVYHLTFCWREFRLGEPRYWGLIVEDLAEARAFEREVAELVRREIMSRAAPAMDQAS